MAPVIKALQKEKTVECQVAVTAQHREMLDQVLHLFDIRPDFDLNIMKPGQTLTDITSGVLTGLGQVMEEAHPDLVLVHGDTTTTFAAALAAFYRQIPTGHVEAGLRTGDIYSPYPEEANRKLTAALVKWHFSPTQTAKNNLLREGYCTENIFVTGNTVIDALLATVQADYRFAPELDQLLKSQAGRRMILVTTHRRENWGDPMRHIYRALAAILDEFPDTYVIFPVHKNPRVSRTVREVLGAHERVFLIEPMDYAPFVNLMAKAYLVLTDSGGIQEEAPSLGKPVLVVRETTERPEAVEAGTVCLVGTQYEQVYARTALLLKDEGTYQRMAHAVNPYGDGLAAQRIVAALKARCQP